MVNRERRLVPPRTRAYRIFGAFRLIQTEFSFANGHAARWRRQPESIIHSRNDCIYQKLYIVDVKVCPNVDLRKAKSQGI